MKIPKEIRDTYAIADPEADLILKEFDENKGSFVLEVGGQDAPIASILAKSGFAVTGVDLRESDQQLNYLHIKGDFCKIASKMLRSGGEFDAVIACSSLEHFGLNTYKEGVFNSLYDAIAVRYVYDLLKPGGNFYVTVPFGGKYKEMGTHWRVYDWCSFYERIMQDFQLCSMYLKVCEDIFVNGTQYRVGDNIPTLDALSNIWGHPNVSCFAKLKKVST